MDIDKTKSMLKKIIFAAIPVFFILFSISGILNWMESERLIDTHRPDDTVTSPMVDWFKVESTPLGEKIVITASNMLKNEFYKTPAKDVLRVMIFGGSFAMGSPYIHQDPNSFNYTGYGDIGNWIRAELAMRFPDKTIELLNLAGGGNPSMGVSHSFEAVFATAGVKAHLVVVATGNNEGFIPFSPVNKELQDWVLYRALKKTILPKVKPADRVLYTPQDPDSKKIEELYQQNISTVIDVTEKKKVPLVLCTMPINLRYQGGSPDGMDVPYPEEDAFLKEGVRLLSERKLDEALEQLKQSPNLKHSTFYIGKALELLERHDEAREFYKLHVQLYPKNRTRPSFNNYIREQALLHDVILADLEKLAEKNAPNGLPGDELFADNCHLGWAGYHMMGQEILKLAFKNGLISKDDWGRPKAKPSIEQIIERFKWTKLSGL